MNTKNEKKSKFEEDWWDVASSEMTTGSEK